MKIPKYAKDEARKALELRNNLPKSKQFGITREEAKVLGINSGVERAKQIIMSNKLSDEDVASICRFHIRFDNCDSEKCMGAKGLWGGERFGKKACKHKKNSTNI